MKYNLNTGILKILSGVLMILICISCDDLLTIPGDPRSKLIDAWTVEESESVQKSALEVYRVEIREHPTDSSRILIFNFYNLDESVSAEAILSGRRLTLQGQILPGGFTISGTGNIQPDWNSILWFYDVDDGSGIPESYTAVYTRSP